MENKWDIGEFASYTLEKTENGFRIIIEGPEKFKTLIADKIQQLEISESDLRKFGLLK